MRKCAEEEPESSGRSYGLFELCSQKGLGRIDRTCKEYWKEPCIRARNDKNIRFAERSSEHVASGEIGPFVAAELTGLRDEREVLEVASKLKMRKVSMRQVRSMVKGQKFRFENPQSSYLKTIEEMIVSVRNCLVNFDISIGKMREGTEYYSRSVKFRYRLHQLLDQLINERAEIRDELRSYSDYV